MRMTFITKYIHGLNIIQIKITILFFIEMKNLLQNLYGPRKVSVNENNHHQKIKLLEGE